MIITWRGEFFGSQTASSSSWSEDLKNKKKVEIKSTFNSHSAQSIDRSRKRKISFRRSDRSSDPDRVSSVTRSIYREAEKSRKLSNSIINICNLRFSPWNCFTRTHIFFLCECLLQPIQQLNFDINAKKEFQSIKSNRESNFIPTRAGGADDVAAVDQLQMPPSYAIELSLDISMILRNCLKESERKERSGKKKLGRERAKSKQIITLWLTAVNSSKLKVKKNLISSLRVCKESEKNAGRVKIDLPAIPQLFSFSLSHVYECALRHLWLSLSNKRGEIWYTISHSLHMPLRKQARDSFM